MSMTENNTHAEIIAQVRIHAQMNIDAEKDKRELGILSVEGAIANDFADELEAAHKREVDALQAQIDELTQKIPQPDPAWCEICEKCHDGEEPPDCEYFGEPNGCNSPIYGEHPRTQHANTAKLREALKSLMDNLQIHAMMPCEQITMNRAEVCAMIEDCRAALAAPARNCDVGSASERGTRCLAQFHTWRKSATSSERLIDAVMNWCDMPYESEATDGK